MKIRSSKLCATFTAALSFISLYSSTVAEEEIIQEEKMSFERCLNVITTGASKLSIAPEITEVSDNKRIAVFTLSDGLLTITCDGEQDLVTVSADMINLPLINCKAKLVHEFFASKSRLMPKHVEYQLFCLPGK